MNNKGSGILEILISGTMLIVLLAATSSLVVNYKRALDYSAFEGRMEDIRIYFRNQFDCQKTVQNNGCSCKSNMTPYSAGNEKILSQGEAIGTLECTQVGGFYYFKPLVTVTDSSGVAIKDPYTKKVLENIDLFGGIPTVCDAPTSGTPTTNEKYKYLPNSVGLTMAQKANECAKLGADWAIAKLETGVEVLSMRTYLAGVKGPVAGKDVMSLPVIETPCEDVKTLDFPSNWDPTVNCTGSKLLVNWPGVDDDCEKNAPGPNCFFQDGENEKKWPVLCEYNGAQTSETPTLCSSDT